MIALLGTFTVTFAFQNELFAAGSTSYQAGGDVTGRVNMAPSEIDPNTQQPVTWQDSNFKFRKGDKLYAGDAQELGWQLVEYQDDYKYYGYTCTTTAPDYSGCTITQNQTGLNSWLTLATHKLTNTNLVDSAIRPVDLYYVQYDTTTQQYALSYPKTNLYKYINQFNQSFQNTNGFRELAAERNLTRENNYHTSGDSTYKHYHNHVKDESYNSPSKGAFILNGFSYMYIGGSWGSGWTTGAATLPHLSANDLAFSEPWFLTVNQSDGNTGTIFYLSNVGVDGAGYQPAVNATDLNSNLFNGTLKYAIRPAMYLDISKVVFGVSIGSNTGIGKVREPSVKANYTALYQEGGQEMKVRLKDNNLSATLNHFTNSPSSTDHITQLQKDGTAYLNANANSYQNSIVSALVFDATTHKFLYYKPLEPAAGTKNYEFDTTGMAVGKYKIAVVNEIYTDNSTDPSYSSLLSDVLPLEIVEPLKLSYTQTPQNNLSYYEHSKNVSITNNDKVGELTYKDGVSPYTFNVVPYPNASGTHANDYKNFEVVNPNGAATQSSPMDVQIKTGAPASLNSANGASSLKPGLYKFRIQGYDANGDPVDKSTGISLPIDKNDQPVSNITGVDKGRVTDDIDLVIYPTGSQLDYVQDKNTTTNAYYTNTELNAMTTGDKIGSLTFQNDAEIAALANDGYIIKEIKLVKHGTSTVLSQFNVKKHSSTDVNTYDILKNGNFTTGNINFDVLITFQKDNVNTVTIHKDDVTFIVPGGITFYDPDSANTALGAEYEYTYDPSITNEFDIMATDKIVANNPAINTEMKYCLVDANGDCEQSMQGTAYDITLNTGAQKGTVHVSVHAPGSADKDATLRAYLEDSSGNIVTYTDIKIIIKQAVQTLTWKGTDIFQANNNVTQVSNSTDTWEVTIKYSGSGTDSYTLEELLDYGTPASTNFGISSDMLSSNMPSGDAMSIQYTVSANNPQDAAMVNVIAGTNGNPPTITLSGSPSSDVTITAKADAKGDYADSADAKLILHISTLPILNFVPEYVTSEITAGTPISKANQKVGELSISDGSTGWTYGIDSIKSGGNTLTGTFTVDSSNGEVKVGSSDLVAGEYEIIFKATKNGDTITKKQIIKVVNAAFDVSTWRWEENDGNAFSAVGGSINTTTKENSTTLTKEYEPNKSFSVRLTNLPAGASVKSYTVKSGSTTGIMTLTDNNSFATLSVLRTMSAGETYMVEAEVQKAGYANMKVYLPINITKYTQSMKFKNTDRILYIPNNGDCIDIEVEKNSTYWNEGIAGNSVQFTTTSTAFTTQTSASGVPQVCSIVGQNTSTNGDVIKADLAGDANYKAAPQISKRIVTYPPGNILVTQSIQTVANAPSNVTYTAGTILEALNESTTDPQGTALNGAIAAKLQLQNITGGNPVFKMSSNVSSENGDKDRFAINATTGEITIVQDPNDSTSQGIVASELISHGNIYYLQIEVMDVHKYVQTIDVEIVIDNAQPDFYFTDSNLNAKPTTGSDSGTYPTDNSSIAKYTETFTPQGAGILNVYTNTRMPVTYTVDNAGASDVISQTTTQGNSFNIDHAVDVSQNPIPYAYVKACVSPTIGTGYKNKCIYAEIDIKKADQPLAFVKHPEWILAQNVNSVQPIYTGHYDSKQVLIQTINTEYATKLPLGSSGDQAIKTKAKLGTSTITAYAQGDRDYNPATASTQLTISDRPETQLLVSINPSATPFLGDTNTEAEITLNYDPTKPAYYWSGDPTIVDVSDSNVNDKLSDPLLIKQTGTTDIHVCQIDVAFNPSTDDCNAKGGSYGYASITVEKIPLELKIADKTIYKGEAIKPFTMESSIISGALMGNDSINDFPVPSNSEAYDGTNILTSSTTAGNSFKIKGSYTAEANNPVIKNYDVTIRDGNLTVLEDASDTSWYHLTGADSGQTLDPSSWHNEDVYVTLDPAVGNAGTYDEISLNSTLWDPVHILVSKEDENQEQVYFRINPLGTSAHKGAMSDSQSTTIKIDKTNPTITSIEGKETNRDAISQLLHNLTFGTFFKPGSEIKVRTIDPQPQGSGTVNVSGIANVDYKVYELDKATGLISNTTPIDQGTKAPDSSGDIKIRIQNTGFYRVCAISHDNAGNDSAENCSDLFVKKINTDGDGDGEPDFNDPDGDGCPDLNIILGKDTAGNPEDNDGDDIKLNVAKKGESKPYLNIDTDGDGKPDINVDTDKDGKPDLNIMNVTSWNPTICVTGQVEEYCTDGTLVPNINVDIDRDGRPDINIDLDGDGIPDIDIDTDGDGLPDINKDINRDGTPDENLKKLDKWEINPNIFEAQGKKFQTMTGLEPDVIDEIRDGDFIIEPSDDTKFKPDYVLVVDDITGTMDDGTKADINKKVPDGQEIKYVYDVQLWEGTKHIQPDGKVKVKIPAIAGLEHPKLVIEQADGTYVIVDALIENGHYVYESDFLGKVSVIGDEGTSKTTPDPTNNGSNGTKEPVKGSYTVGTQAGTSSIGGALTGDVTNIFGYVFLLIITGAGIYILRKDS